METPPLINIHYTHTLWELEFPQKPCKCFGESVWFGKWKWYFINHFTVLKGVCGLNFIKCLILEKNNIQNNQSIKSILIIYIYIYIYMRMYVCTYVHAHTVLWKGFCSLPVFFFFHICHTFQIQIIKQFFILHKELLQVNTKCNF